MKIGENVWSRRSGINDLSDRQFIASISLSTIWGLLLTAFLAVNVVSFAPTSFLGILFFGLAVPIAGIWIAFSSDEPLISFLGLNIVVGGFGLILGPCIAKYNVGVILNAIVVTGMVTTITSVAGIIYPKSLEHWGSWLFAGLLGLIFAELGAIILSSFGVITNAINPVFNWFACALFSAYIVFDWNRAMRLPKTLDNAIDCSVAIYLDILNLFLNILQLMEGSND